MNARYCDEKIGERVSHLRRQLYPNRKDFAKQIRGMSYRDISEVESSRRQPLLEEVILLALFLRTSKENLAFGRGRQVLGIQEEGYLLYVLGESWPMIRQHLARRHNGH